MFHYSAPRNDLMIIRPFFKQHEQFNAELPSYQEYPHVQAMMSPILKPVSWLGLFLAFLTANRL